MCATRVVSEWPGSSWRLSVSVLKPQSHFSRTSGRAGKNVETRYLSHKQLENSHLDRNRGAGGLGSIRACSKHV